MRPYECWHIFNIKYRQGRFCMYLNRNAFIFYAWSATEASPTCCIIESHAPQLHGLPQKHSCTKQQRYHDHFRLAQKKSLMWKLCPAKWFMWHWRWRQLCRLVAHPRLSGRGRPLRLISSSTQTQSGDIIHQLFTTNKTPHRIKSILTEPGVLLKAGFNVDMLQPAWSVVAILCLKTWY